MLKYTETTLVITLLPIISLNGSTVDPSWPADFIYVHNASLGQFIINNCMDVQKNRMYRQLLSLLLFDKPYFVHEHEN